MLPMLRRAFVLALLSALSAGGGGGLGAGWSRNHATETGLLSCQHVLTVKVPRIGAMTIKKECETRWGGRQPSHRRMSSTSLVYVIDYAGFWGGTGGANPNRNLAQR